MNDGSPINTTPESQPTSPVVPSNVLGNSRGPSIKQIATVVAILGAGILLTALTSDVTKISEPGIKLVSLLVSTNGVTVTNTVPFLPAAAGDWVGGELQGLTKEEKAVLPADTEGARRVYKDKTGDEIYCSVVLAGKDVTSIHRPELCLPGQGWKIESEYVETVPTMSVAGGKLQVMRMNAARTVPLEDGGATRTYFVFAYWFVGKDRLTPYHWQRIFWTTKDRVLHNRNHRWAYFLINARVKQTQPNKDSKQDSDAAMQKIAKFVQDLYPSLSLE